ncbi:unnamed protein product, partial [Adineta steineri]
MLITDDFNHRVQKFYLTTNIYSTTINQPSFCPSTTWYTDAITFANSSTVGTSVYGVFVGLDNTVYVANQQTNKVVIWFEGSINPDKILSGSLSASYDLFATPLGDIYVDNGVNNRRVDKFSLNSNISISVMTVPYGCTAIFVDISNTLYCSTFTSHQVVKKWLNDNVLTSTIVAGTGTAGSTATTLNGPIGIFVDAEVNLYVTDSFNERVQIFPVGQLTGITLVGASVPGTITLYYPNGITLDGNGYLFIADCYNQRIVASGPYGFRCLFGCTTIAGSSSNQLSYPTTLRFDSYGNLYVADNGNSRVQKFLLASNSCSISYNQPTFCSNALWYSNASTFASSSTIGSLPYGIFINGINTVYVPNRVINTILSWPQGSSTSTSNSYSNLSNPYSLFMSMTGDIYIDNGYSYGRVDKYIFNTSNHVTVMNVNGSCYGLFIDIGGNLYCSLKNLHQVVKLLLNNATTIPTIAAGNGSAGSLSNMLNSPQGIYVDSNSNLYIADSANNRIQFVQTGQLDGVTVVGNGSSGNITLNYPTGIVLDANGYLFIVDSYNHRIVASSYYGFRCIVGCSGGGSSASQLSFPQSLAFDSYGNMYVTDRNNSRVQQFTFQTSSCTAVPQLALLRLPPLRLQAVAVLQVPLAPQPVPQVEVLQVVAVLRAPLLPPPVAPLLPPPVALLRLQPVPLLRLQPVPQVPLPLAVLLRALAVPPAALQLLPPVLQVLLLLPPLVLQRVAAAPQVVLLRVAVAPQAALLPRPPLAVLLLPLLPQVLQQVAAVPQVPLLQAVAAPQVVVLLLPAVPQVALQPLAAVLQRVAAVPQVVLLRAAVAPQVALLPRLPLAVLLPLLVLLQAVVVPQVVLLQAVVVPQVVLRLPPPPQVLQQVAAVPLQAVAAPQVAVQRVVAVLQVVLPRVAVVLQVALLPLSPPPAVLQRAVVVPPLAPAVLQVALQPRPPLAVPRQAVAAPQVAVPQSVLPLPLAVPQVPRLPSQLPKDPCYSPTITLIPGQSSLSSPMSYRRSQDFSISSMIQFNCDGSLSTTTKWTIKNCTSTSCSFEIILNEKVMTTFSELYIPSRTLAYGVYQLTLTVTMIDSANLKASSSVYVRITATGITANLVQLGTSMITRGDQQDLLLDPGTFSVDPDEDTFDATKWKYTYYCRIYDLYNFPNIQGILLSIDDSRIDPYNPSCLSNRSGLIFGNLTLSPNSSLTVLGGSLQLNQMYQFMVYMENRKNSSIQATGYVLVTIEVTHPQLIAVGCVISSMCVPNLEFQLLNPTTQVALFTLCIGTCTNLERIKWHIYQGSDNSTSSNSTQWTLFNQTSSYENIWFFGTNTSNFTATDLLFLNNLQISLWRFEVVYTFQSAISTSALNFIINQPPANGSCSINPLDGTITTLFTIECPNWYDVDGIQDYSLYAWTTDTSQRTIIAFSPEDSFQVRLPAGDNETSLLNLVVYVRDLVGSVTQVNISFVNVIADFATINDLIDKITNLSSTITDNPIVRLLSSGNQNVVGQIFISLSQEFNQMNVDNLDKAISSGIPAATILVSSLGSSSLEQISMPFNESALIDYNRELNSLANVRDYLVTFITNLLITTSNSIILQSSSLVQLTQATNQLTRNTLMLVSNRCYELSVALYAMFEKISYEDAQSASNQLFQCASNLLNVKYIKLVFSLLYQTLEAAVNGPLQGRTDVLDLDYSRANAISTDYDTDLESQWSNLNLFSDGNDFSTETIEKNRNLYYQKQLANQINSQV